MYKYLNEGKTLNNAVLTAASVILAFSVSNCDMGILKENKNTLKSMYKRLEVREKLKCGSTPSCFLMKH